MRARNIKPGFFIDADLSEVDFASRLLFIGLWCYADREGRFKWIPKQIKASIFPYDDVDINKLLSNLMSLHVITCHDGVGYVENFKKHQHPHPHEAKTTLPEKPQSNQCHDMSLNVTKCQADIRINDIRIPDIKIDDSKKPLARKPRKPPSTEHKLFSLWWCFAFERVFGSKYPYTAKDAKLIKNILDATDQIKTAVCYAFYLLLAEEEFYDQSGRTIGVLHNQLAGMKSKKLSWHPITEIARDKGIIPPEGVQFTDWKFWESNDGE